MSADIKAIFFDLDGTLVDKRNEEIPASAQTALRALREKGVKMFISSGRPLMWANLIRKKFDLTFHGKVLLNGQYCVDENDVAFYQNPLTPEQLGNIHRWMERHPQVVCTLMEANYAYTNIPDPYNSCPVEAISRSLEYATYQISPQVGPEMDDEILSQVEGVRSARWNGSSTDLIPASGGKPVGMQKMLERFGLRREECMAFGDGANDIEMLQYAGLGIAMGNGTDEVKKAADYVTDAVDEDGIANALRHFGLL